ncbi:MAG TPA: membrane dipeptidase [Candidatus Nitrosotalea sp.]|jgi:membrane dipeptidase|nr:membrane dipeptidase [Candidatus Nitrosotalea sp.]
MASWQKVLYESAIVWDAHACLPLEYNADMSPLERHRKAGATFVSVNVGMDFNPLAQVIRVIAGFRDWLSKHSAHYILAQSVEDVRRAKREGKLAVAFDLEGSVMLEDDLAMVGLYRDLGVRQIHLAYNLNNSIAGGCHDGDRGLTELGRAVVREINRVGMLMDCSHSSRATALEIMEVSSKPVIFSHANVQALVDHRRNIDDERIQACARTDGVVGVNGIGLFLGNTIEIDAMIRHVDYLAEHIGTRHIGIGIDYAFDSKNPQHSDLPPGEPAAKWWPREHGYGGAKFGCVAPEKLPEIAEALSKRGYKDDEVVAILGGNFMRAAEATWIAA